MLAGIDAAVDPFPGFKIDTVVIRGVNDDEIIPLLDFAKARGAEIRFIEYMDVGGATTWSMSQVVSRKEMLETIAAHYGPVEPLRESSSRAGGSLIDCRTAPSSASSRRRLSRSANRAIAAD